jgi:hypothetical protein
MMSVEYGASAMPVSAHVQVHIYSGSIELFFLNVRPAPVVKE